MFLAFLNPRYFMYTGAIKMGWVEESLRYLRKMLGVIYLFNKYVCAGCPVSILMIQTR